MKNNRLEDSYDGPPPSNNGPIPRWLFWTYIILPIWGLITFYIYVNGSVGWLDRGYWHQLQHAANTVYPYQEHLTPPNEK